MESAKAAEAYYHYTHNTHLMKKLQDVVAYVLSSANFDDEVAWYDFRNNIQYPKCTYIPSETLGSW